MDRMHRELTPRQKKLLDYLEKTIARHGRAPSLREAAQALGISHTAVAQGLRTLENKACIKRDGRYSRTVHLLNRARQPAGAQRWQEVPIIGRVTAGLPMYAQQEWDGGLVVDADLYPGRHLFALRIQGDSMVDAAILDGDIAICEPRQYARNGEIVVALVNGDEATVKYFFLRKGYVELRPANPRYRPQRYDFADILVQGKVIGLQRGPEGLG